jgi:carbon storage regulator
MLVLSRKTNEEILIGNDVRITIVSMQGGKVRLGIDAPRDTNVVRTELLKRDEREQGFRKPA